MLNSRLDENFEAGFQAGYLKCREHEREAFSLEAKVETESHAEAADEAHHGSSGSVVRKLLDEAMGLIV